jgi:hypothetical protein
MIDQNTNKVHRHKRRNHRGTRQEILLMNLIVLEQRHEAKPQTTCAAYSETSVLGGLAFVAGQ